MKRLYAALLVSALFWGLKPITLHATEFPGQFDLHNTLVSSFLFITRKRLPQDNERTKKIFAHHIARVTNVAKINFGCQNPVFATEVRLDPEINFDYLSLTLTSRLLTCN